VPVPYFYAVWGSSRSCFLLFPVFIFTSLVPPSGCVTVAFADFNSRLHPYFCFPASRAHHSFICSGEISESSTGNTSSCVVANRFFLRFAAIMHPPSPSRALGLVAFASLATAHMHMVQPVPYNAALSVPADGPLGSLAGDGGPFPCQGASTVVQMTPVNAGDNVRVSFDSWASPDGLNSLADGPDDPAFYADCPGWSKTTVGSGTCVGTSVHDGGSCSFSVSYDYPTGARPGTWKTIYVIIGGCPSQHVNFNAPTHTQCGNSYSNISNGCVNQFDIPIPADMPSGDAAFAWVWYNAVGTGCPFLPRPLPLDACIFPSQSGHQLTS
jgi:hypothetical protein